MNKEVKNNTEVTPALVESANIDATAVNESRRSFLRQSIAGAFGAAAMLNIMPAGLRNMAYAAGSENRQD